MGIYWFYYRPQRIIAFCNAYIFALDERNFYGPDYKGQRPVFTASEESKLKESQDRNFALCNKKLQNYFFINGYGSHMDFFGRP